MACVVLVKYPAAVPCATADEESGSNLKLGSCVDQPHSVTKELFKKNLCQNKPLHVLKTGFTANEPQPYP